MRFDYAIMNPPYDRNLHLKFLEKVIKVAGKTVNISPVRWLQDPFARYKRSTDYSRFEDSISKHIERLDIVAARKASGLFNASFIMDLGIYVCTDKGGYDYSRVDPLVQKIMDKTMESSWSPYSFKRAPANKRPFVINVSSIAGKDNMTIMNSTYESQLKTVGTKLRTDGKGGMGDMGGHFEFDTEEERRNFYDCYTSPFMKWTYSLWKTDIHLYSWKVPYFGDYTKPWTNARFCEYFGITGFVSDTEAEPGSEWETILETMKKYA